MLARGTCVGFIWRRENDENLRTLKETSRRCQPFMNEFSMILDGTTLASSNEQMSAQKAQNEGKEENVTL